VVLKEMATLPHEYRHEPKMALEAGDDGLCVLTRILLEAAEFLSDPVSKKSSKYFIPEKPGHLKEDLKEESSFENITISKKRSLSSKVADKVVRSDAQKQELRGWAEQADGTNWPTVYDDDDDDDFRYKQQRPAQQQSVSYHYDIGKHGGLLICEVGGSRDTLIQRFPELATEGIPPIS